MTTNTLSYEAPRVFEVELELEGAVLNYSAENGDASPF